MSNLILDAEQLIKNANGNIERNIEVLCPDNVGLCAQNILSQLRNLIDAFALLLYYKEDDFDPNENGRERTKKARKLLINTQSKRFPVCQETYHYLEKVASHFTQDQFESKVLLHKYQDLLFKFREEIKKEFGKDVLNNLESFPFKQNNDLKEYYHLVFLKLRESTFNNGGRINTFYVDKKKRRCGNNGEFIYEYILTPAKDNRSKYDRLTAFSLATINDSHAIKCKIYSHIITFSGIKTRVNFIGDYSVSIRPCEIVKFAYLEKYSMSSLKRGDAGYKPLMAFLTNNKCSLYDLITSSDFDDYMKEIQGNERDNKIYDFLRYTKKTLDECHEGHKTLKYLLYTFRHDIMKHQEWNIYYPYILGDTNLSKGCQHFERLPFSLSLIKHNPQSEDVSECLLDYCSQDQLLKRRVIINTEYNKTLFSSKKELDKHYLTDELIKEFNSKLTDDEKGEQLLKTPDGEYVYTKSYVDDTLFILKYLGIKSMTKDNKYQKNAIDYLLENPDLDIDDTKKKIIKQNFANSSVLLINGAAGTGKTTLIKHLSNILSLEKVLFLSCTNTSVQNLRRRVGLNDNRLRDHFMTIETFLRKDVSEIELFSIAIIDECSMVSNRDFKRIVVKKNFSKLLLVGDEKQIESIKFGNWFGIANERLKRISFELPDTHRTADPNIYKLWSDTRNYEIDVETFVSAGCLKELNNELFTRPSENVEEIILCLAYDGLYGINNINRYMQELNPEDLHSWNVWSFKKGDRILFNESYYFKDYFYNNQKGLIQDIKENENEIVFDVRINKEENNNHSSCRFVEYLSSDDKYEFYRIKVNKKDDDDDENEVSIIPFQLGYAISIHKSQGLEYDSVKVVITKEVEESISHNIFYTAITRCKNKLQIYTDKTSLQKVISGFKRANYHEDAKLIDLVDKANQD